MLVRKEEEQFVALNWTAIASYSGSLLVSVAVWIAVIRAIQHLVK